ncbi:axonemal 84 kDa protein-like isoform X3 [Pomacea canaliculata]|uniref:axonemal 84 kDa protein-like isoform X3 n=1 Tax=Pomacea canaliculata TaxID=400727 RepID=UPI000D734DF5|nr:axonemal 84 kDa protein-like isoform X3 [Pomacea canaliculata]
MGKKKPSKTDRSKMKKEEEEKTVEEEEEERLRILEEQKRKQIEARILKLERQKLENEEKKCRRLEMGELMSMLFASKSRLQANDDKRRKEAKWARYMRCDGSPDPTIQGEINTYINLRLEDTAETDVERILKDTVLDLTLIAELESLLIDTPLEDLPQRERDRYRETIGEIQHLVQVKLDAASLKILCDASSLQDPETSNLQYTIRNADIVLCVWGNLSKNPRIKSFEFTNAGCSFDIPRQLTLSDCAIRYMRTTFDHFSAYSKSFYPRCKFKEPVELPQPEEEVTKEEIVEPAPAVLPEGEASFDLQALLEQEEQREQREQRKEHRGDKRKKKSKGKSLKGALTLEATDDDKPIPVQEQRPVIEEDYKDPPTPEPLEWEDFDEEDNVVDLRAYHVVGGIFTFDLLCLPPQPKVCKNWTITQLVVPEKLQFLDYVVDVPQVSSAQEKTSKDKEDKRDEKPPINITLNLPHNVLFLEEPQLAWWDANKQYWRTDGLSIVSFDEENQILKFSASRFGPMCLLQDSHINMPFQSWELRPHGINAAVLTIIAAISEIEIEIKDGLCCLSKPSNKPELSHLQNQWVTVKELVENMRKAGLNVFPAEDSSKFVTVQNKKPDKHPLIVGQLYSLMGLVASAMAFSWSKWNSDVESSTVVLLAAESLNDEALLEEDWSVYMATKRRFMKLKMNEFDEEFNEEMAEDIKIDFSIKGMKRADFKSAFDHLGDVPTRLRRLTFKSNLYHYAKANLSGEALMKIDKTSKEFSDCVQQLLNATQVLTFS